MIYWYGWLFVGAAVFAAIPMVLVWVRRAFGTGRVPWVLTKALFLTLISPVLLFLYGLAYWSELFASDPVNELI